VPAVSAAVDDGAGGVVVAVAAVGAEAAVVPGAAVVALALPPLLPELHPDRTRPTITTPNAKGVRMFTLRA
jgi:hypothetical protein